MPQTPGGSRRETIASKAKQFNNDLHTLQNKFAMMEDVNYDRQKVAFVFLMTEQALEQREYLGIILERLKALDKMNQESPQLEARMQAITQRTAGELPQQLVKEQELAAAVRKQIIEAAGELDQLV